MPWQGVFDRMSNKIVLKVPQTICIQKELGLARKSTYMGHSFLDFSYLSAFQGISLIPTHAIDKSRKKVSSVEKG